jgi:crotonobetainyl-CoA:carnitine CoA-transferase CaiB-like acyl-CoA transferase
VTALTSASSARSGPTTLSLEGLCVACVGTSRAAELLCSLLEEHGARVAVIDPVTPFPDRVREALATVDVLVDPRPVAGEAVSGRSIQELQAQCPADVICCSLPSFSSLDPELAHLRASDELLAAMTGTYLRDDRGGVTLARVPISACFTALTGALGVMSALIARDRDGGGQTVEVPEFDATFLGIGVRALVVNGNRAAERPSEPWGGPFRCKDGRFVWMNLATAKAIRRFASELGVLEEWAREGFLAGAGGADLSQMSPGRHDLNRRLVDLMLTRTAAEWDEFAVNVGLAITAIRSLDEESVTSDPDLVEGLANMTTVQVSAVDAGADEQVVAETANRHNRLPVRDALPPLAGVKVVDISQMLAGPCAGRMLAELGATVIKINDPHEDGAGYRWQENRYHTDVNRGKATVLLDLTTSDGQELTRRMLSDADVLIENMRSDAASRLGVDEAHLRVVAPRICHAHVAAFTLESRPDAPGYEPNGQAIGGLMLVDTETGRPRVHTCPINDYGTGLLCALGVLLSLYDRRRGGRGAYVHASLSQSAFFFARAMLARHRESDDERDCPSGQLVRTGEDWVVVDASAEQLEELLLGLGCSSDTFADVQGVRVAVCEADAETFLAACSINGLPASELQSYASHGQRPDLVARGLMHRHDYGDGYEIIAVGNPIRLLRTPTRTGLWVSRPGKDGPQVLAGLGVGTEEYGRLLAKGVVAVG